MLKGTRDPPWENSGVPTVPTTCLSRGPLLVIRFGIATETQLQGVVIVILEISFLAPKGEKIAPCESLGAEE